MKIVVKGKIARDELKRGIDLVADAVRVTLGPAGKNAVLGRINRTPTITNDGVSIAHEIEGENEIQNQGVWMVKEAATLTDIKVGDGTTTTTVILQELVNNLFDKLRDDGSLISKKVNTIALKRQIDEWCEGVVEELEKDARPLGLQELYNVALVSAEYPWLAKIITEVYEKIGKDGFITIEEGIKNDYETYNGMELGAGYHSEYYITNDEDRTCVLEHPLILVTNQRLDIDAILPLAEKLSEMKANQVIFIAPDFTKDLLNRLSSTRLNSPFTAVALKLQTYDKDDLLIDIATLTQAKFIDKNVFAKYEDLIKEITFENLGRVERAVVGEAKTVLHGGEGDTSKRVAELRSLHDRSQSEFDKYALEKRIAHLSQGFAVIRIAGNSEFERGYFKLKAQDAVNAVQVALQDGVVKGGGLALKEISERLPENILSQALKKPYDQIQENYGEKLEIPDSVIDPVKVTISALRSACSLAGMIITTETVVAYRNEDSKDKNFSQ